MAKRSDILWVTAQFALFGVVAVSIVVGANDPPGFALVVGGAAAIVGVALGGLAIAAIGFGVSPFPTPTEEATLVVTGPYRLVRHPIYGGVILVALGLSVVAWSPAAVAASFLLAPFFVAKSSHEEKLLTEHFDGYADYMRTTRRRLIPWVV